MIVIILRERSCFWEEGWAGSGVAGWLCCFFWSVLYLSQEKQGRQLCVEGLHLPFPRLSTEVGAQGGHYGMDVGRKETEVTDHSCRKFDLEGDCGSKRSWGGRGQFSKTQFPIFIMNETHFSVWTLPRQSPFTWKHRWPHSVQKERKAESQVPEGLGFHCADLFLCAPPPPQPWKLLLFLVLLY